MTLPIATPQSVSVHFVNELKDHLEAQRLICSKGFFGKADKVVAVLLLLLGICSTAFVGPHWWTIIWFPLAVVEWFDLLGVGRLRTVIAFRRNPKFREEYNLTFSYENIHFKTVSIDSTLQWTHYERVLENPNLFVLLYGTGFYTLIPKQAFHSKEEMDAFRALLGQRALPINH